MQIYRASFKISYTSKKKQRWWFMDLGRIMSRQLTCKSSVINRVISEFTDKNNKIKNYAIVVSTHSKNCVFPRSYVALVDWKIMQIRNDFAVQREMRI